MKTESPITIANRYCNSIKEEISLMSARINEMIKSWDYSGFMFHNLACKGEMLNKYHGDKLRELGLGNQLDLIITLSQDARDFQTYLDDNNGLKGCTNLKVFEELVEDLGNFNKVLQSLVPTLFFI